MMRELGYLKGSVVELYKVSRCLFVWNDVTVNWSRVGTWFGTCSAPGTRMRARGLVHSLFVAQTTWFGMPDVCSAKGEWVEHSVKGHEIRDGNNVKVGFRLGGGGARGIHGAYEVTFIKRWVLLER